MGRGGLRYENHESIIAQNRNIQTFIECVIKALYNTV